MCIGKIKFFILFSYKQYIFQKKNLHTASLPGEPLQAYYRLHTDEMSEKPSKTQKSIYSVSEKSKIISTQLKVKFVSINNINQYFKNEQKNI